MKKNTLSVLILISGILISGGIISLADAQAEPLLQPQEQKMSGNIQYPISELGNCKNKNSCKIFCDDFKNSKACLAFAEQHNLMSSEELTNAKKFTDNGMVGPGGCKGQAECDQYCGNSEHVEECITFAQKNGMMSQSQLEESQKVLAAIKRGVKPPACGGPEECNKYCSSSTHMEECINFGIEAGIIDKDKQEEAQKVLAAIKRGIKPPACNGPQECDAYCGAPEHMEECINFGIETGMMPKQEQEQAQKMLSAIKQGIKPPACRPNPPDQSGQSDQTQSAQPGQPGQPSQLTSQPKRPSQFGQGLQACDQYCADPSHIEECVKFSVAVGNMTEEQAKMSMKTGGKGPGGCIGKNACETFCNNPDNEETCFNFGKDNGMIPQEDLQRMREGQQRMKDSFNKIPEKVLNCITTSSGADVVEKMKSGSFIPNKKSGKAMNQCFQQYTPQGKEPNQNQSGQNQPGQDQQDQPEDKFRPGPGTENPSGRQMPQQAGPGGCKGPEECQKYCASNPEVCKNFQPQQNQPNQPGQMQPEQSQQPQEQFNQGDQPGQQPGQFIQGQPGEPGQFIQGQINQPGQMEPQQQLQPQIQQQEGFPPPPSSFLQGMQNFLANVLDALK